MDINKVIEYLETNNNVSKQSFINDIKDKLDFADLIIHLLSKAENGDFFELKKPKMVRLCETKYSYYSNNYDNCIIEELIGCNNCEWYVSESIFELFKKFEKEGFPTDEELDMLCI